MTGPLYNQFQAKVSLYIILWNKPAMEHPMAETGLLTMLDLPSRHLFIRIYNRIFGRVIAQTVLSLLIRRYVLRKLTFHL